MIGKEDIEKLALLVRISVSDEEKETFTKEIESILEYVSEIQSFSGDTVEKVAGENYNVFREDGEPHESGVYTEILLAQAPQREGEYVKVKKIL